MEKNQIAKIALSTCGENLRKIRKGITKNGSNMARSRNGAMAAQIEGQCNKCYALWASNGDERKIGCFTGKLTEMVSRRVSGDIAPQCEEFTKLVDNIVVFDPDKKRYFFKGAPGFFKSVH